MTSKVDTTQAKAYIARLELPKAPPGAPPRARDIAPAAPPAPPVPAGMGTAVVVGPQIASFDAKVEPGVRSAISKALLLANLAAQHAVGGGPEKAGWFAAFKGTLTSIGWAMNDDVQKTFDSKSIEVDVNQAIIDLIAAIGAGGPAATLIVAALEAMKKVGNNAPWITLFAQQTEKQDVTGFNVAVITDPDPGSNAPAGSIAMRLVNFSLHSTAKLTQVLFIKVKKGSVNIAAEGVQYGMTRTQALGLDADLETKLQAYLHQYIADVVIS